MRIRLDRLLVAADPISTHGHVVVGPEQVLASGLGDARVARVRDEQPLLFHTGMKSLFPTVRDAVATLC